MPCNMECAAVFSSNQPQHLLPRKLGLCGSNGWRTLETQIRKAEVIGGTRDGRKIFSAARTLPQRQRANGSAQGSLEGRVVAFTTPHQYAIRLEALLRNEGAEPLWCPTIVTEQSEQTQKEVEKLLSDQQTVSEAHGVAFTSRSGIKGFADALNGRQLPLRRGDRAGNSSSPFVVAALGKDAELLHELGLIGEGPEVGISLVVPAISTPQALVEALGEGRGRKLICPVPLVEEGLQEPPVVPEFLAGLKHRGWEPIRVNSYVTRWLGLDCARELLVALSSEAESYAQEKPLGFVFKPIDALIFTSTAEIEGLLKSLDGLGHDGALTQALQRGTRQFLIASHGPVTALGAERLGLQVDVVGKAFQSFDGIVQALRTELDSVGHSPLIKGSFKR